MGKFTGYGYEIGSCEICDPFLKRQARCGRFDDCHACAPYQIGNGSQIVETEGLVRWRLGRAKCKKLRAIAPLKLPKGYVWGGRSAGIQIDHQHCTPCR